MKNVDGKYVFEYDAEKWLPHAHDSISGKFIHGDDIRNNEGKARAAMATDEAKARKAKRLERALDAQIPPEVYERIEQEIEGAQSGNE